MFIILKIEDKNLMEDVVDLLHDLDQEMIFRLLEHKDSLLVEKLFGEKSQPKDGYKIINPSSKELLDQLDGLKEDK